MKNTIFLDAEIEVLVVSAGGVGTTFLLREFAKYKTVNDPDNRDGFKHLPLPPFSRNENLKVIYIFGNPLTATVSLFRRKYQHTQSIKMQQYAAPEFLIPYEMTLSDYTAQGKNGLPFRRHFENWKTHFARHEILFLRYETLFENLEIIREFLNLPTEFLINFPSKKLRKSSLEGLEAETLAGLNKMYGALAEETEKLPDFWTQRGDKTRLEILKNRSYRRALVKAFWQYFPYLRKVKNTLAKAAKVSDT